MKHILTYRGFKIFWMVLFERWGFTGQRSPLFKSRGTAKTLHIATDMIDRELEAV